MREILFRGKRIDNGEWVCGSFCMDALELKNGLCGVDGFIRVYDFANGKMQMYEVDRETVGQYTGLTDKHGKRIFEGDIVRAVDMEDCKLVGMVDWRFASWIVSGANWADTMNMAIYLHRLEIIGNIHDNPELLKGGAE